MNNLISHSSPNWNERPVGTIIDTVVIHYTGMKTGQAALDRLCDPMAEVSAHYLIEEDGRVFQLVAEEKRAWHAGVSHWRGRDNLNHNSIGIELVNPGHEFGYKAFPDAQITALLQLLEEIHQRHNISPANIIGHSDIAFERKTDPGELFPWKLLHQKGFGLFSHKECEDNTPILQSGDEGSAVEEMHSLLKLIGYNVTESACFDRMSEDALVAFQTHWRQTAVTGVYDQGTKNTLQDIAEQIARCEDLT